MNCYKIFKPSHYLQACTENLLKTWKILYANNQLLTKHYVKLNQNFIDAIDQSEE